MTPQFAVRMAWRNLWRQKRRTMITAAAIAVAIFLSLFMRSMQEGSYAHNLDTATRFYSGYLQLQHPEFYKNQSIDELLPADQAFVNRVHAIKGVTTAVPRLESFALGSAGDKSKGVIVMGIDPVTEDAYSKLANRIKQGNYFEKPDEDTALIGGRLAQYLGIHVGDELILYGQGYHGVTASGIYTVRAILDYPGQQLDSRIVYLPLKTAQKLYATGDQVSAWVLHGHRVRDIPILETAARKAMGDQVKVRNWADISPDLSQQITMDRVSGQFLIFTLYVVVGFSLFATIVMMTLERQREFAVILAAGMVRRKLQGLVVIESIFLALIGVALGLLVTLPVLLWFYYHPIPLTGDLAVSMKEMGFEPILPFTLQPTLFVNQILVVLMILVLCSCFPLVRIGRLKIANALKG